MTDTAERAAAPHRTGTAAYGQRAERGGNGGDPTGWSKITRRASGLVSLLVLIAGLVTILSALTPERHARLELIQRLLGLPVATAASAGSAAIGVVLVLLARGLRRHKRRAWLIAVPLLAVGAALHLIKGLDVEEALLNLCALSALLAGRRHFWAQSDPAGPTRAITLGAKLLGGSVAIGLLLLFVNRSATLGDPSLLAGLATVARGLIGVAGPVRFTDSEAADRVSDVLLALGLLSVAAPLALALRTSRRAEGLGACEAARLRALLPQNPADSLGYFTLRGDKDVVFSPSGKAAIGCRLHAGVLLAGGDPLGDPEAWPSAIDAFLQLAARYAWVPAVLGCSTRGGHAWARAGLSVLEVGDEAIVDATAFSLQGRTMRGVRQAVARTERAGYTTSIRRVGQLQPSEVAELQRFAERHRVGRTERGFSMALGRLGGSADERCVVVTAHRTDGDRQRLTALLHFVPWGEDGLSLDLMRRDRDTTNGVSESLIVAALQAAPTLGVRRLSLNFAVFRSALAGGERLGAGPVTRAWRTVLLAASRFWQIDSLYRFNAKFQPQWEPRFLCYPSPADLPRVTLAAMLAEAFLTVPRWRFRSLQPHRHRKRSGGEDALVDPSRLEGEPEHLADVADQVDRQAPTHLGGDVVEVGFVARGQQDGADAGPVSRQ